MVAVPSSALRASISSHTPITFGPTHEPRLPFPPSLPSPFLSSLSLTPPRSTDVAPLVATLNSPLVYPSLRSPPYPYLPKHADFVIASGSATAQALVDQWERDDWTPPDGCPFNNIRGVGEGGEEVWVGALGVRRWPFDELEGEEKERKVREMMAREAGDPEVIWTIGFYIDPAFHGNGVMTRVLRVLIDAFMVVPVLKASKIRATMYVGNVGSRRVFEKNGFELVGSAWVNAGESRGGMMKEEWWFEWHKAPPSPSLES